MTTDRELLEGAAKAANEQAPKVRAMMLAALDVLRRGME